MFELLAGTGVALPGTGGLLRFGMDEHAAGRALAALADARPAPVPVSPAAPDAAWGYSARWGDLTVAVRAGGPGRAAGAPREPLLHTVVLRRARSASDGPGGTPVVLDDIDLFGYPAAEVLHALGPVPPPGLWTEPPHGRGYLTAVALGGEPAPPPAGRRTSAAAEAAGVERALAGYAPLWTTERDRWQLQEAGGGHLPRLRDEPGTTLLVCDDALARRIAAAMLAAGVEVVPETP
ncbi:hypothetical protein ACIGZJ_18195 [Kitasatospora sp. NPDC052868]|uniref:hypothetical protein n=1 Tax=Kitasatospora sp. NPDC052868 TaxID=3364060 RepID=UPI0037C9E00F